MKMAFWLLVLALTPILALADLNRDPYEILGVNKGATVDEIKRQYKRLAKEWHPDRNESPEAQDRFIELQEAYELLCDPGRRENYDRLGVFSTGNERPSPDPTMDELLRAMMFGPRFRGSEQAAKGYGSRRISRRTFEHNLVPKSQTTPYLLFVHADWCGPCVEYYPIWEELRQDLEHVGYGMGTVNKMLDSALSDRLRARPPPSFVALIQGRTIAYRGSLLDKKSVYDFAKSVLPSGLVHMIASDDDVRHFVDGWRHSNKVSVILVSGREQPRLRYMVSAMVHSAYARFAYIHTKSPNMRTLSALNIKDDSNSETLLVFNDEPEQGPIARLTKSPQLDVDAINQLVQSNRKLVLPRVSSSEQFDSVCPVSGAKPRKLCCILVVPGPNSDVPHVDALRKIISDGATGVDVRRVNFAYMHAGAQQKFVAALEHLGEQEPATSNQGEDAEMAITGGHDILVAWRFSTEKAKYSWLRNVWHGGDHALNDSAQLLAEKLAMYLRGDATLQGEADLLHLVDEHAPGWFRRAAHRAMRMWEAFMFHATKEELLPALSAIGTLFLVVTLGYLLNYAATREQREMQREQDIKNRQKSRATATHKKKDYEDILRELRAETYFGMVRLLKPGCRTLIVLVSEETKDALCREFRKCIWPWRNNKTLLFGYVLVNKNIEWFRQLLAYTLPIDEENPDEHSLMIKNKLDTINPNQTVGTVLSLNGWHLYFCMYHPKHAPSMVGYRKPGTGPPHSGHPSGGHRGAHFRGSKAQGLGSFIGFDDQVSSDEENDADPCELGEPVKPGNVLAGLPNWLDRLFDGQMRRYYLPEFPPIK